MENLSGQTIKGYELKERLGAGSFGAVYKAHQSTIQRDVAIKVILPYFTHHPDFIRRFEAEAQLVARLEHPYITPLYDYWRDTDGAYLVMRWLRGGSLQDALHSGPFGLPAALLFMEQITAALTTAHRNQVIHRDLKPANILLDEDSNAYLADFGIAKDLTQILVAASPNEIIGSPDYISPEQVRGEELTPQTDFYALGIVLFEMLTGHHPFKDASIVEMLYKHLNDPLPEITTLPKDVSESINALIQKATAKNPIQRYQNALEMAAAFRAAAIRQAPSSDKVVELLTRREQEILQRIIDGLSNKEIAQELFLTHATVKWYVTQLYSKLGVRSRMQAIIRARELRLVVGDSEDLSATAVSLNDFNPDNPYKGLRAFQTADYDDFFGREKSVQKLVTRISETGHGTRFLAVVGPSGSGKSSLIKAGLIPALWRGDVSGSEKWFVVEMLPGAHPLEELEIALTRVAANQAPNLREQLERDERGLLRAANLILAQDGSELVLVIDQFEEVFTMVEDEARRLHFLNLLHAAATDARSRVYIIVTLRADYYDRPLYHPLFGELLRSRMETVLPLSAEELERAIAKPAERVGVQFEDGLVAAIVGDVNYQPAALPLLQYALTELFEHRSGKLLTHEVYIALGRAVSALAKRADEVYLALNEAGQEVSRQMFLRLVTLGEGAEDTRRRASREELLSIVRFSDEGEEILDTFAEYRLLTFDHDPGTRVPTVELAHEAILREWDRLRLWLNDSRDEIKLQRQLSAMAAEWSNSRQDASYLARGSRLEQLEKWMTETTVALTPVEREYITASLAERERQVMSEAVRLSREKSLERRSVQSLRMLVGVLLIAAIGGLGLATAASVNAREASRAADVARSLALAADSQLALSVGDNNLALNLGMAALEIDEDSNRAELALSQAAYAPGLVLESKTYNGTPNGLAITSDGRYMAVGLGRVSPEAEIEEDNSIRLIDLQTGEEVRRFDGHIDAPWYLAFSPDDRYLVSGGADWLSDSPETGVIVWDVAMGKEIRRFSVDGPIFTVTFSPDGQSVLPLAVNPDDEWHVVDGGIKIWDIETGENTRSLAGDHGRWRGGVFTPDGRHLVIQLSEQQEDPPQLTVLVIDTITGETTRTFLLDADPVTQGLAFASADNRTIFLTGEIFMVLDIETGEYIRQEVVPPGIGNSVGMNLSPDGKSIAFGTFGGSIHILDIETWEVIRVIQGHSGWVTNLIFTADSKQLISAATDGIRVWDLQPGTLAGQFEVSPPLDNLFRIRNVLFMPDGQSALSLRRGDGAITLHDLETGKILKSIIYGENGVWGMDITPDGQKVLIGASDRGFALLYDLNTGQVVRRFPHITALPEGKSFEDFIYGNMIDLDISPDGQTALTASQNVYDGVVFWDLETGVELHRFRTSVSYDDQAAYSVSYSPDGSVAIVGRADGTMVKYDLQTFEELLTFGRPQLDHTGGIFDVAFSPDGTTVVSASIDATLILWDVETGALLRRLAGHSGEVRAAAFSPDGRLVASASVDQTAMIWDVATGEAIRRYIWDDSNGIFTIAYSPDGKTILLGSENNLVTQWRVEPELDDLLSWIQENRIVTPPTCIQRQIYDLKPLCETADP
jgi:WD40 repeat protein/serine/threonine protein kinase